MFSGNTLLRNTGMALGFVTVLFAGATALAGPASAATVTAQVDGTRILVNGSAVADGIDVSPLGGFVTVSNTLGSVAAGPGCRQLGSGVRCPTSGITRVDVFAGDGNDAIRNNTTLPSTLSGDNGADTVNGGAKADLLAGGFGDDVINGGAGDDQIRGLAGNDRLSGGAGIDRIDGGGNTDSCDGESEINCEL